MSSENIKLDSRLRGNDSKTHGNDNSTGERNVIPDLIGDPENIKLDSRLRGNDTTLVEANPPLTPLIKE